MKKTANNVQSLIKLCDHPMVTERLLKSSERITRAYAELFSGYQKNAQEVLNDVVHVKNYQGTIKMEKIHFYSMCEHHFLPFLGTCSIEYQPNEIITGLGKLVRLVKDVHGPRLQIQEIMTKDICDDIMNILKAKGCRVVTRATHLCVCSRGPQDDLSETVCVYSAGSLLTL
ncbi:MAG: GTP cyclohydrolase I FolE [Bacteroidetes bacterium]|nr:GTP cyclohydrolase I FolE [Bacteroidota bacterium]